MARELTAIAPLEEWAELVGEVERLFGFHCTVYDRDNKPIRPLSFWANQLCRKIKEHNEGSRYICAVSQQNLAAEAKETGNPVCEECNAGFVKVVVPIFDGGEYVGTFGGCGLLSEQGEIDRFLIARTLKMTEEQVSGLSADVKRTKDDAVARMISHIETRLREMISRRGQGPSAVTSEGE